MLLKGFLREGMASDEAYRCHFQVLLSLLIVPDRRTWITHVSDIGRILQQGKSLIGQRKVVPVR